MTCKDTVGRACRKLLATVYKQDTIIADGVKGATPIRTGMGKKQMNPRLKVMLSNFVVARAVTLRSAKDTQVRKNSPGDERHGTAGP